MNQYMLSHALETVALGHKVTLVANTYEAACDLKTQLINMAVKANISIDESKVVAIEFNKLEDLANSGEQGYSIYADHYVFKVSKEK
jgi:hypothetical protein